MESYKLFGTSKIAFNGAILKKYLSEDNNVEAKNYINSYFLKNNEPLGVAMWIPTENKVHIY